MKQTFTIILLSFISCFGFSQNTLNILTFEDLNGNGIFDSGEGMAVPYTLTLGGNTFNGITDQTGNDSPFAGSLPAGNYTVEIAPSFFTDNPGYQLVSGANPVTITLGNPFSPGPTTTDLSFGFRCFGNLSGTAFSDDNKNGSKEGSETGLGGWQVIVEDVDGTVYTTTTGLDGEWSLDFPIPNGNAEVTVLVFDPDGNGWRATTVNPAFQTVPCGGSAVLNTGFTLDILPVELVDFSAETTASGNQLSWTTASELNNDYYSIEYSLDGIEFTEIGTVDGNGTVEERSEYTFLHQGFIPTNQVIYYRLKQVDFGEKTFEYSDIVIINPQAQPESNKMYPNPVMPGQDFVVESQDKIETISIIDFNGQVVRTIDGNQSYYMPVNSNGLNSGYYLVVINGGKTLKMFVQ